MDLVCVTGPPRAPSPSPADAPQAALSAVNADLLAALGGRWDAPPHLPPGWADGPRLEALRRRARRLAADHTGGWCVWGDPTTALLLPFWEAAVGVRAVVVVCDEPGATAAALRGEGVAPGRAAELWWRYLTAAVRDAPPERSVTVVADDRSGARRAAARIAAGDPAVAAAVEASVASYADTPPRGGDGEGPATAHGGRVTALEEELDRHRTELDRLRGELGRADRDLARVGEQVVSEQQRREEAEGEAERLQRELEMTRRQLRRVERDHERLRGRRVVRLGLRVAELARPLVRLLRRVRRGGGAGSGASPAADRRHVPATPQQEAELRARLEADLPAGPASGPRVSVVVLNRSGEHHLRRSIPGLAATAYDDLEVIVVDNASEDGSVAYLESFTAPFPLRVLRNEDNRSFSEANNQGVAAATGDLVLLMNNDVEPITPGWLGRMVETLQRWDAVAVGARLVYPRRPGLDNAGDVTHPDLTLQHRGIHFVTGADGYPLPRNLGAGGDPLGAEAAATVEVPAVTAACMLVRRDAFDAVGGLSPDYVYGTEDVDLCLKLRERGGKVVYDGKVALWHHEFGTQNAEGRERKARNRRHNREVFVDQWGPRLYREVLADRIGGGRAWSHAPLHVAITVTRDDPRAGWGDWYTAHDLGDALADLGWRVSYLERYGDRWYEPDDDVDVVVVLLDAFDLHRLPPHIVTVAWIRNWTDRWVERPWFDDFDVVLASSAASQAIVERRTTKKAHLFPLATNPTRFRRVPPEGSFAADVLFVGNYWDEPRAVTTALPQLPPAIDVAVYGRGWERVRPLRRLHRGVLAHDVLPVAYSSAAVVLDDTAGHTKPYAAVNARVFDALACGAVVVSDNPDGVRALFDDDFPVWDDTGSLQREVEQLLADDERRARLADRYQAVVLQHHTYTRRAEQLRDVLRGWCDHPRVGICVGVPAREQVEHWGDYHYARDVQRQLERLGYPATVHLLRDWSAAHTARSDVVVHLFGLSELFTRRSQLNVLWNISHPDLVTPELCVRYDVVFVASERFARALGATVPVPVVALHQATEPDRFFPDPSGPEHDLLFVGNSRKVRRRIIDDLTPTSHDLAVYGRDWSRDLIDVRHVRGTLVPNRDLRRYYSSAAIVLNDHWPDMREHGYLSNRLYDALACGAFVISDHVDGIDEEFDGGVVTYRDPTDLREKVARYLADPPARRAVAERGRRAVLARHTFEQRVAALLAHVAPALAERALGLGTAPPRDGAVPAGVGARRSA